MGMLGFNVFTHKFIAFEKFLAFGTSKLAFA